MDQNSATVFIGLIIFGLICASPLIILGIIVALVKGGEVIEARQRAKQFRDLQQMGPMLPYQPQLPTRDPREDVFMQ